MARHGIHVQWQKFSNFPITWQNSNGWEETFKTLIGKTVNCWQNWCVCGMSVSRIEYDRSKRQTALWVWLNWPNDDIAWKDVAFKWRAFDLRTDWFDWKTFICRCRCLTTFERQSFSFPKHPQRPRLHQCNMTDGICMWNARRCAWNCQSFSFRKEALSAPSSKWHPIGRASAPSWPQQRHFDIQTEETFQFRHPSADAEAAVTSWRPSDTKPPLHCCRSKNRHNQPKSNWLTVNKCNYKNQIKSVNCFIVSGVMCFDMIALELFWGVGECVVCVLPGLFVNGANESVWMLLCTRDKFNWV